MQAADRGVGVERPLGAVLAEDLGELVGVLGQVLERHGAVLDEGHGLPVALHRHHDVEPRLSHFPQVLLRAGLQQLHDAAGEAQVRHELREALHAPHLLVAIVAGELHQQDRVGRAAHMGVDGGREGGNRARELDHRAVHELHGAGPQLHDVLGRVHRVVEAREVRHAERLVLRDRGEVERDALEPRQRAFAAHEELGEVLPLGREAVEVVAGHPPRHLREPGLDLVLLPLPEGGRLPGQRADRRVRDLRRRPEAPARAVGEAGVDRRDAVDHVAVGHRPRAAGVVAGHAAEGRLRRGRHVHGKPEPVLPQLRVEDVQHDARLHHRAARLRVHLHHAVQVLARVDDEGRADGLPALGGAAAAREHGNAGLDRDLQCGRGRFGACAAPPRPRARSGRSRRRWNSGRGWRGRRGRRRPPPGEAARPGGGRRCRGRR